MSRYYIKPLCFWFSMLFLILAMTLMTSCGKRPVNNNESIQQFDSIRIEKSKITERNRAIGEQLFVPVPKIFTGKPECDSVARAAMYNALQQVAYYKQSGDNSFRLGWNAARKQFEVETKVGATENVTEKELRERHFLKTIKIEKTVTIIKTSDFMKYSAYAGWLFAIYLLFKAYKKIASLWPLKLPIG